MVQAIALLLSLVWLQGSDKANQPKAHLPNGSSSQSAHRAIKGSKTSKPKPPGDSPKTVRDFYGVPKNKGGGTIAVVIPFHYPTPGHDLDRFSEQFGLAKCNQGNKCLRVIPDNGPTGMSCEWAREAALSLQWTHAMAPKAHLLLVEANSDSAGDLFPAVERAAYEVIKAGGGEVVLPWILCTDNVCERPDDYKYDHFFIHGVVYFAATGDTDAGGGPAYPSTSPKVVSVGGTLPGDHPGDVEKAWIHTRGGASISEPKPSFQDGIENTHDGARSVPDIAVSARSVAVYFTSNCPGEIASGWQPYRGATSSSAPIAAGMANAAGRFYQSSEEELTSIYANRFDSTRVRDITMGGISTNPPKQNYDSATGVGAPLGMDFDAPPHHK